MNKNPFDLSGKVALVTGASRGLGQYFARALARAGADLVITSRDPASLMAFKGELELLGRRVLPLPLDVRSHESIEAMAKAAIGHYGKIDILVNNAGYPFDSNIWYKKFHEGNAAFFLFLPFLAFVLCLIFGSTYIPNNDSKFLSP